jgi:hypothetical protein
LHDQTQTTQGHASRTARALIALAACLVISCSDPAITDTPPEFGAGVNPLATLEQAELDARIIAVKDAHAFTVERALLRSQFQLGHGLVASDEALTRLDNAIDELVGGAIAMSLNSNGLQPRVHWLASARHRWFDLDMPGSRWAFDNPDNAYRTVPIDPDAHYVLHGRRSGDGPSDMTFSLINDAVTQGTDAFLDGKRLALRADGRYEITIDPEPANDRTNHLQSTAQTVQLFIRSNLGDWTAEDHDALRVELLDAPGEALSDADVAARASTFLLKAGPVYGLALLGLKTMAHPVNTLPAPSAVSTPGALVTQANSFGHFRIDDDEGLLITLDPGGADYFVVPVTDPWMVGVDPGRQTSLNQDQAVADADGRYTFVVSLQDPGIHNWLDAAGLHEGTLMVRWQRLADDGGTPAIDARLIRLADLPRLLPGTPVLSNAQREQQLRERRTAYQRRFRVP